MRCAIGPWRGRNVDHLGRWWRWRWRSGFGAAASPTRFRSGVLHAGRPPVAEGHLRRLERPRWRRAVIGTGPLIGSARTSRPDPTLVRGASSTLDFWLPRILLVMLSSLQSDPSRELERSPLSERPECEPPGSAIATAALGPAASKNAATTPTPAATRRFAGATIPLLQVANTRRRCSECIVACRSRACRGLHRTRANCEPSVNSPRQRPAIDRSPHPSALKGR